MWPRINSLLNKLEEVLLISLLVLMVILAFLPILFRNVIATGLIWIDPLLRHLVLWVALLGASLATRQERHIKIDLLSNYLPAAGQRVVQGGLDLLAALVCLSLVVPGIDFVRDEAQVRQVSDSRHPPVVFSGHHTGHVGRHRRPICIRRLAPSPSPLTTSGMGLFSTFLTVLLALAGTPLFIVIALSGLIFLYFSGISFSALIIEIYKLAHTPMLVALPLFALAGYILAASKAPQRLVRLSQALLGWLPGGLAVIALFFRPFLRP